MLKELVKERLMAAADEILALFEGTIASYEEELSRTREENERLRQQHEAVSKTHNLFHVEEVQQLIGHQEHPPQTQVRSSTLKQLDPQPPHVKEEEEELQISQEGECLLELEEADLTTLPLTGVSVKTEDHEDDAPESSQLHHSPSEENRGVEPPSSRSSPQHMTTEADGDHRGGSQADKLLAPLSDSGDTTSHSPEDEEALSSDADCEGDVRTHTDNKHSKKKTGKKYFTCSICTKRFFFKSLLTQHMRTHTGEKPFSCSVCDNTFTQRSTMMRHMATHTGEKPFSCSVCGKRFSQNSHRLSHMTTHTGEKPYSCSVCVSTFTQRSTLMRHMATHTGEKPFSCSVCGKRFSQNSHRLSHMTTHTREKPYSCSVCGETFSVRSHLTGHMRTHPGEKPFSCSVCAKGFSRKSNMVDHMRRHRGEQEGLGSASDKNKINDGV
ncbi:zinc finger protein OZF-like [Dunckerocampus dactyliophorus]|uniref:zinc finger protein OZF-like n=1 Tax=Dunckerocampus dactyliophorus TaxID=161453 RepID=UPI002404C0E0|nr:zinc finger protein OZF-like [Dunckerocampus dactyliophorus]